MKQPNIRQIVLASSSPRRKELLALAGLSFTVDPGDYSENMELPLPPHALAKFHSVEKARSVAGRYKNALIISADTFIVYKDSLLGKPHTKKEAARMLHMLNGKTHSVITGFTVMDTANGNKITRSVETYVTFRKLTTGELEAYINTGEPLDKAGAYAIQGLGSLIVKKIDGDYFNVIGLPLSSLAAALKRFGVRVL